MSKKLIPNCTSIPNILIDEYMPHLSETAIKILFIICRQTYGWIEDPMTQRRKEKDWISYTQLVEKTKNSRSPIAKAIKTLEDMSIIEVFFADGTPAPQGARARKQLFYRIRSGLESRPDLVYKVDQFGKESGLESRPDLVYKVDYTKEDNTNVFSSLPNKTPKKNTRKNGKKANEHVLSSIPTTQKIHEGLLEPLSYEVLWKIAKDKNVSLAAVKTIERQVRESIANGNKYKTKSVYLTTRKWIDMGMSRGQIQNLVEEEQIALDMDAPENIASMQQLLTQMREVGML